MNNDHTDTTIGDGFAGVPETPYEDQGLSRIDALLAQAGAADRRAAAPHRIDRIASATASVLGATPQDTGIIAHIGDTAARTPRHRTFTGIRLAAAVALMLSVGAAVMALRSTSRAPMGETTIATTVDATTDLDALDALFADAGVDSVWTDAEALHTRVSSDMSSYWGSDELFGDSDAQNGASL